MSPVMGARLLEWLPTGGLRLAVALLTTVIAGGTVGYVLIEGWSAWDAFYMTVTTITTVGYREVHELSRTGQVFTVFLLIGGVGTALYTFTLLATTVVEGGLPKQLRQRRHARMLESIKDHFIVCGYGRIGSIIAREFSRRNVPFVIIERESPRVQASLEHGFLTLEADASAEDVLRKAGLERARGLIAVVGTDAENVYAVLSARVMRPDLFIIGRAESEDSVRKLKQAGANRVISPYQIGAQHIAQSAISPAVVDFVQLATSSENLELAMEEVTIGERSSLANRSILDSNLRQRFGVIVVAIQRHDRRMDFNPEPDASILPGDTLVVLGRSESLKRLEVEAGS
jgi:voltage-gated potassium channel